MSFSKKPFRLSFHLLLWTMILGGLLAHPFSPATSSPPGEKRDYVLIISSYTESSKWDNELITEILTHISRVDNFEIYSEYMNNLLTNDREDLEKFIRALDNEYGKKPPRVLVLFGSPMSLLRDFVKQTWPDVSIVFCSEFDYVGPDEAYLAKTPLASAERTPVAERAREDNLTYLEAPNYLRENIHLMQRMIPGMNELVFVGDRRYINRQTDYDLRELVARDYPEIRYRFFSAGEMTTDALLDSLSAIDVRRTGVLFSSWYLSKQRGDNQLIGTESSRIIASSPVPLFGLKQSLIRDSNIVGGYVYDNAEFKRHLIGTIDAILHGQQARNIPFYKPLAPYPIFNYDALVSQGFTTGACPANSLFFNKPASLFERYKWPILLGVALMLLFIVFQQARIRILQKVEAARRKESESQARYSTLFNNMPIVYIQQRVIFDNEGNPADLEYVDVNARFERVFIPREQVIGRRLSAFNPVHAPEFLQMVHLVLTENRTITYPFYYNRLDVYYDVVICRSFLPDHVDVFCLDSTALHKAQHKLASINHKLSMALDVAEIVPWKWDLAEHTIHIDRNQWADEKAPDNEPAELPTISEERYFAKVADEDRDRVRRAYNDLIEGRTAKFREQYRIRVQSRSNPHIEWVEVQAAVEHRDVEGRPLSLVGSSLVITERKRMEQELTSARDRAEESNRLKSAFLANMSHEIRTPLNAIVGFSEILATTEEQQEKQEYVSIIENNNALLLQLIGDILDLSKIEAGTLEFVNTSFELNTLMREKRDVVALRLHEGVELIFDAPETECCIRTDRNRLSQVITNLLTNAAKFTVQGSIRMGYELRDEEICFFVSDTGCGIPSERKEQVFDRFVKLNNFKQGTGLGLSICRTIVEHLGGRIGVESEEGQGATFWFTLPYEPGQMERPAVPEQPTIEVEKDKLTILIAEDNDSNYRLFESILRRDYRLLHALNGQEAVDLFREHRPHIVLMDINMPVMNGYEATAEIRKLSADVPIVAVTAFAFASDEQKILSSGFNGYMPKPINATRLKAQILDILKKRLTVI